MGTFDCPYHGGAAAASSGLVKFSYYSSAASSFAVGALIQRDKPVQLCQSIQQGCTNATTYRPRKAWTARRIYGGVHTGAKHITSPALIVMYLFIFSTDLRWEITDIGVDGQEKIRCLHVSDWTGGYIAG